MDVFNVFLPVAGVEFNWLILLLIGFSVGVMGGFFGMGGGWIVTPALNIFGFPMSVAIGTDMLNIFGQSIVGFRKHAKLGNVQLKLGMLVGGGMVVGVEIGKRIVLFLEAMNLAGSVIRFTYIGLLGGLAVYILRDYFAARKRGEHTGDGSAGGGAGEATAKKRSRHMIALVIGLGVGMLAGFLGVGGGFALVPAFIYLLGLPTNMAVGTSVLCCVISGAYGGFTYAVQGRMELIAVVFMLTGASFGAQFGASAVKYAGGYGIRFLYGVMLLVAAGSVLLKQLDEMIADVDLSVAAQVVVLSAAGFMCIVILSKLVRGILADRHMARAE